MNPLVMDFKLLALGDVAKLQNFRFVLNIFGIFRFKYPVIINSLIIIYIQSDIYSNNYNYNSLIIIYIQSDIYSNNYNISFVPLIIKIKLIQRHL